MTERKISEDCYIGKYYLYRHIRLDKNEPFYIGVGTKSKGYKTFEKIYRRAYSHKSRNRIWKSIVNRTEFSTEILLVSDDMIHIKEREKEFISLYGRIDNKSGSLANFTDGGDGHLNPAKEIWEKKKEKLLLNGEYEKMVNRMKQHPANYERIGGLNSKVRKDIYVYNIDGKFLNKYSVTSDCYKDLKLTPCQVFKYKNTNLNFKTFFFYDYWQGDYLNMAAVKINLNRKANNTHAKRIKCNVIDLSTNEIFYTNSIKEAQVICGYKNDTIGDYNAFCNRLRRKMKTVYNNFKIERCQ
jgi:hypothetical protein